MNSEALDICMFGSHTAGRGGDSGAAGGSRHGWHGDGVF